MSSRNVTDPPGRPWPRQRHIFCVKQGGKSGRGNRSRIWLFDYYYWLLIFDYYWLLRAQEWPGKQVVDLIGWDGLGIFEELTSYRLFASLRWASRLAHGGTQSPPGHKKWNKTAQVRQSSLIEPESQTARQAADRWGWTWLQYVPQQ